MTEKLLPLPDGHDPHTQRMVATFAAQLDAQLEKLKKAVDGLTLEQLEWQSQPGMNTIGMLLAHIAVAETFWINVAPQEIQFDGEGNKIIKSIIGIEGDDDGLPLPEAGTHPKTLAGKSLDDYLGMLAKCRKATHKVLLTWTDDSLDSTFTIEEKYSYSRSWTLYHTLEHLAGHLGQVLLLKHIMCDEGVLKKDSVPRPESA